MSLDLKWVSYRELIVESFLKNPLCSFMSFHPFTFKVILTWKDLALSLKKSLGCILTSWRAELINWYQPLNLLGVYQYKGDFLSNCSIFKTISFQNILIQWRKYCALNFKKTGTARCKVLLEVTEQDRLDFWLVVSSSSECDILPLYKMHKL